MDSEASEILDSETETAYELTYPTIQKANKTKTQKPTTTSNAKPTQTTDSEKTLSIQGVNDPLSNFHKKPIKIQNSEFATGEHYFQYQKAVHFHRLDIADQIADSNDPFQARTLSKEIEIKNMETWNQHSAGFMLEIFKSKYEQHIDFRQKLLDSVDSTLVLTTTDKYWGTGYDNKGRNEFGKLLMTFRTQVTGGDIEVNIDPTETPPPSPPPHPTMFGPSSS